MKHVLLDALLGSLTAFASLAGAQTVSPPLLLPGDATLAPAAGDQLVPALARGGDQVLAVWQDGRTNLGTSLLNLQGGQDIYAARFDAAGVQLDRIPIVVNQDPGFQTQPRVAWNGSEWLVAFNSPVPFFASSTPALQVVRVAADGSVLDPVPLTIPGTDSASFEFWSVAGNGSDFVVVWKDSTGSSWSVFARRIGADGTLLDAAPITLLANIAVQPYRGSMALAGDEFLLAWEEYNSTSSNWNIRGRRFSTALAPLGAAKNIATDSDEDVDVAVASDGTDFYVAWERYNTCCVGGGGQVRGTRVNHAGTVLDGAAGTAIYGDINEITTGRFPSVAWDGSQWVVSFVRSSVGFQQAVYAARIASSGVVLDSGGVLLESAPANQYDPAVASLPAGGALVAWDTVSAGGATPWDVRAAIWSGGAATSLGDVALGAPTQTAADAVDTGDATLVAFLSAISGQQRVLLSRVDAAGTPLDAAPVEVAPYAPGVSSPHVGWNGSVALVSWDSASGVLARRYDASLVPLDPAPTVVAPTGHTSDVASVGGDFLVAYLASPSFEITNVYTRRVSGSTGAPLDAAGVLVGGAHAGTTSITAFAGGYLVAWQSHFTHDDPHADVRLVRVSAANVPGATLNATNSYAYHREPRLAASDDVALVTWHQDVGSGDMRVLGRRISPAGAFVGNSFVVDDQPLEQQSSAVAFTGSEFAVGWEDHRHETWLEDARSDVFGARVAADGTVTDPTGFALAETSVPEFSVAVAGGEGSATYAFSTFESGVPYAAYRIAIRVLDPPAGPWKNLGHGLSGLHGTPLLAGTGTLQAGSAVGLSLSGGKENAAASVVIGLSAANVAFKGGTLVPSPDLLLAGLLTDGSGALALAGTWPGGVASGLSFWSQCWIADAAAAKGLSASNGLQATTP